MKFFTRNRALLLLLICAFIIRILTMLYSFQFRENTDILRWKDWGRIAHLYNLAETYKKDYILFGTLPNNMPPGTTYIVHTMYQFNIQISKVILRVTKAREGSLQWVNSQLLNTSLRIPSIISDLFIGVFIFLLVKKEKKEKYALFASSLFLFNPVVIYNSAFWGQMDSLNNVLFFIALYSLLKKRIFITIFFFLLSLFVKFSLLPFLPILFVILFLSHNKKKLYVLFSSIISFFLILIFLLPISHQPFSWLISYLSTNSFGEMQNITAFAFNFWWLVFKPFIEIGEPSTLFNFSEIRLIGSPVDSTLYNGLQLKYWAFGIFTLLLVPIVYKLYMLKKHALNPRIIFAASSLIALLIFLFLPRMHDRYMYPVFPLLATYIGLTGKNIFLYIALAFFNFLNLYIVWHPMMVTILSYDVINNKDFQWAISFGTVIVGLTWYMLFLKSFVSKKT